MADDLLTAQDVAELIGCTKGYINQLVKKRGLPMPCAWTRATNYKGRMCYYNREAIESWMRETGIIGKGGGQTPKAPPPEPAQTVETIDRLRFTFLTGRFDPEKRQLQQLGRMRRARQTGAKSIKKIRTEGVWG